MSDVLSHAELEQLLPAAALEVLEGNELLEVTTHARECTRCARQLESYREVVASLATALPQRPLDPARSAGLRTRVLARAAGRGGVPFEHAPAPVRKPGSAWWVGWAGWAGWAVAAGLSGLLLVHHSVHRPLAYGWLAAGILSLILLALVLHLGRQRARLSDLEDQLAALTTTGGPPSMGSSADSPLH